MLFKLIPVFISTVGGSFPELGAQRKLIERVIHEEEQSFLRTLESGVKLLDQLIADLKQRNLKAADGRIAFELYDTYGFPLDLTELMLKEQGMEVNHHEFNEEMQKQRSRSKSAAASASDEWIIINEDQEGEDFAGYDHTRLPVKINRYRKALAKEQQHYHLVFDQTPFYAESGGQVGDTGVIDSGRERIKILDTFKEHGLIIHVAEKLPDDLSASFTAIVDDALQEDTARNHTATHLLHHALREVLGKHIEQKGSLVNPFYLRFDFSHFHKLTEDELNRVETLVNKMIRDGIDRTEIRSIAIDEAKKLGAIALFGEKYDDRVRVIKFGDSVELCGGIHVESTTRIGLFKIISESSIAAGIRRIEAITGDKAVAYYRAFEKKIRDIEELLNQPQDLVKAISRLNKEKTLLEKKVDFFIKNQIENFKRHLHQNARKVNNINIVSGILEEPIDDADIIRDVAYQLRGEIDNLYLVIGAIIDSKPHLAIMISDRLIKERNLDAGEIVRIAAREFNGRGGGQSFFATAGGKDSGKIDNAINKALELVYAAIGRDGKDKQ